jgi:hypothetical protein
MNKENKRGITNIEMVVAIILFVLAVFTIVLGFNAFHKTSADKDKILENFEQNFLAKAQDFKKVDVYVSFSGSPTCLKIPMNENFKNAVQDNMSIYYDGNLMDFNLESDGNISILNGGIGIYEIYLFSFNVSNSRTSNCVLVDYNYSLPSQGKIFSYEMLENINNTYSDYAGYETLKQEYGNDFTMIINDESGNEMFSMKKSKPVNAEIFARNFMIKIYDQNKIVNALVHLEIW